MIFQPKVMCEVNTLIKLQDATYQAQLRLLPKQRDPIGLLFKLLTLFPNKVAKPFDGKSGAPNSSRLLPLSTNIPSLDHRSSTTPRVTNTHNSKEIDGCDKDGKEG